MAKAKTGTRAPRLKIEVTKEEIERALRRKSGFCMIAEAIRRQVEGSAYVSVDLQTIRWTDPKRGLRYMYLTPRIAQEVLVRWDRGIAIPPFTFRLAGAHIISMRKRKYKDSKSKLAHKLGKRRVVRPPKKGTDSRSDTVGGQHPGLSRYHASRDKRRAFGVQLYTLDDVVSVEEHPTGFYAET